MMTLSGHGPPFVFGRQRLANHGFCRGLNPLDRHFNRFTVGKTFAARVTSKPRKTVAEAARIFMAHPVDRSRSILGALILGRRITSVDVAWLRREIFADGQITRAVAEELFDVERAEVELAREWTTLFVELIANHVLWQGAAAGVLNDAKAEWLLARADSCKSANALAALGAVLAEARRVPAWLVSAFHQRLNAGWRGVDAALQAAEAV
jgi:hypothetical protein